MHVPFAVVLAPTHAKPWPHGIAAEHEPAAATGTWHCIVAATHTICVPQPCAAHDVPGAGCAAHAPHSASGATAQNELWHCAANSHAAPIAPGPVFGSHAAGGFTGDRNAGQASAAMALAQVSVAPGLLPVLGAASASMHDSFSRASHVPRSGQRRERSAAEHDISCVQRSWAILVHA
jgi:hypothetical protein